MRLRKLAILVIAATAAACGGEKKDTTDSAATATTPTPIASAGESQATAPEAAAPITGQTVEVKMLSECSSHA